MCRWQLRFYTPAIGTGDLQEHTFDSVRRHAQRPTTPRDARRKASGRHPRHPSQLFRSLPSAALPTPHLPPPQLSTTAYGASDSGGALGINSLMVLLLSMEASSPTVLRVALSISLCPPSSHLIIGVTACSRDFIFACISDVRSI